MGYLYLYKYGGFALASKVSTGYTSTVFADPNYLCGAVNQEEQPQINRSLAETRAH